MEKSNILHLIDHYRIGGPGKTIINSVSYINKEKYQIHVSSFIDADVGISEFSKACLSDGIPYLALMDKAGINYNHLKTIKSYLKDNNIQILHSHGYKTNLIALLLKVLDNRLSIATTYHGWITNNKKQKLLKSIDLFLVNYFDAIISVSQLIYDEIEKKKSIRTLHEVIHNAILLSDYKPNGNRMLYRKKLSVNDGEILIGAIGRLSPEKGCLELIDIFHSVQKKLKNIKLAYIGEGPLEGQLREAAAEHGLTERIIFTGYQNSIQPWYEALDVFVSPSQTEGLSNVILEAMAFELPVIATNVGGNKEIIKNGVNGMLVEYGFSRQFAEAINLLASSDGMRKTFGKNAYQTVKEKFDFKLRMQKVECLYDKMMAKKTISNHL